jgi:hypothetical protein
MGGLIDWLVIFKQHDWLWMTTRVWQRCGRTAVIVVVSIAVATAAVLGPVTLKQLNSLPFSLYVCLPLCFSKRSLLP